MLVSKFGAEEQEDLVKVWPSLIKGKAGSAFVPLKNWCSSFEAFFGMSSECNPNRHAINRLTQQPCNSIHSTITYQYNLQRQAKKPNKMRHEFR